ncbi:diguanylate phosphodiesterase [Nocardioides gansuensis]|uniref:Diguanylate phosphodiesterase n=1 Tax=Nocardioides gansuensis TaxID=2138300 RepID=A0A2T8FGL1_9ACTN|nr:diguanylate phosphodiesterase [Nocardioides gansuensis]
MLDVTGAEFLELLARDASPVEFEAPLLAARVAGADKETLAALEHAKAMALQVRGVLESRRRREAELTALYETASDLAALTDLDEVLAAIVRRARALLQSDIAYLSLNDDERGDTYMRITDGSTSAEFRQVRLPMGAGLGGLVAQTATPYATASYFEDERFRHTQGIDSAVADEGLVSILGVPLTLGKRVIGVLYAANRCVRPFTRADTALLVSLAAHAAIAIDNARLLAETQAALAELKVTSEQLRVHSGSVERAAAAHDRLTALLVRGGGVDDVAAVVAEVLGGEVTLLDPAAAVLTTTAHGKALPDDDLAVFVEAVASSRTVDGSGVAAAPVLAGTELLGSLGLRRAAPLDEADRRILERAAMVTALLLLFRRNVAEAEGRVRGELLQDLLTSADRNPADLRDRARVLGADLDRDHVVVVAEVSGDRSRLAQATEHLASRNGGFSVLHRGRLVLLLPGSDSDAVGELVAQAVQVVAAEPLTAGVSGPVSGPQDVAAAHDEARRVLDALVALGRAGERVRAHELGFVGLLVGDRPDVAGFVEAVLGPVLAYDEERGTALVETLDAYFRNGANLVRTRTDLHVHVNTVTQRLDRVRMLLGDGWQEPERQLEVQLALRLHRLVVRP